MTLSTLYRYLGFGAAVTVTFLTLRACAAFTTPEPSYPPPVVEQPAPPPALEESPAPASPGEELGEVTRRLWETAKEEAEGFRRGFEKKP